MGFNYLEFSGVGTGSASSIAPWGRSRASLDSCVPPPDRGSRFLTPLGRSSSLQRQTAGAMSALMLLSCAGDSGQAPGVSPIGSANPSPARVETTFPGQRIAVGLESPDQVALGQPVPVTLVVSNQAGKPVDLIVDAFPEPVGFDVFVRRLDGTVVFHRLDPSFGVRPLAARRLRLDAGGSERVTYTWDQRSTQGQPVPVGRYQVQAILLAAGVQVATGVRTLQIEAG